MQGKQRILVIDDEESIRFTFESFLSDAGYEVATARNYNEAMMCLNEGTFDLVFADIILGGRTGIEVMREVKNKRMTCPVIIVTGAPNIETASEAVRLGAFDYISKPVHQEMLLRVAGMALKHKALTDEKERYRANLEAIFRSVKDAIITVDPGLRIVELNKAAEDICGLSRDAIGMPFGTLAVPCSKACLHSLSKTIETGESLQIDRLECHRPDGPVRVVTLSTAPLADQQNVFSGALIVVRDETRLADLERDLRERRKFHNIIGGSARMQKIYDLIENLADVQTTVLITGESGTGKELVAEALHHKGSRSSRPLVKVNSSALSEGLLESELFGHVKGAFTGATSDKVGRFQRADRGTIFLDEVGDISPHTQLRLLRVLQEREFERVGDSAPIKVDVRVIAATNQDLMAKVKQHEFREDLYYRLKVVEIALPPLRERTEDIPLLAAHFIDKFNKRFGRGIKAVSADVQQLFMEYAWPGNIREMEHIMEHAFILCRQDTITLEHLPGNLREQQRAMPDAVGAEEEQAIILRALEKAGGNKAKAARILNIDRKTLYRKLTKYQIPEGDS